MSFCSKLSAGEPELLKGGSSGSWARTLLKNLPGKAHASTLCHRYEEILFGEAATALSAVGSASSDSEKHAHFVESLKVHVATNDQSLNLQTDESYVLEIAEPTSSLSVGSLYLFAQALTSQILYRDGCQL